MSNVDYKKIIELTKLDEEEKERIFDRIYKDLTAGKTKNSAARRLKLLTGLPGSGKSSVARRMMAEDDSLVNVSVDDFYQYIPICTNFTKCSRFGSTTATVPAILTTCICTTLSRKPFLK